MAVIAWTRFCSTWLTGTRRDSDNGMLNSQKTIFSIITPVLNRASMIRCAIESVLAQGYPAYEHWIVDGGSADGTLDIVKEYPHLKVIAGPDRNLYDAINKGIQAATGDLVVLLNSDDLLMPGALESVAAAYARDPAADGFCGAALVVDAKNPGAAIAAYTENAVKTPGLSYIVSGPTVQNARILRRDAYARVGVFDDRFRIAADQEFLVRARLAGIVLRPVDAFVYCYRAHGDSLTLGSPMGHHESLMEAELIPRIKIAEEQDPRRRLGYRTWHGWACGYLAAQRARAGDWRSAWEIVTRGCADNPLWPYWFAKIFVYKLARRLRRAFGSPENDGAAAAVAVATFIRRIQPLAAPTV